MNRPGSRVLPVAGCAVAETARGPGSLPCPAPDLTDNPVPLDRCPVCNGVLTESGSDERRCPPPRGCGRRFEVKAMCLWDSVSLPSTAAVRPSDLGAVSPTRTEMGTDGIVRRKRVRS